MCKLKSGIILKDRIFVPDYDSHTKMLDELGIKDTRENAERLFVRAELVPPDGDVFKPIDEWKFNVDQDILPEWFVKEIDGKRMRAAVKEWADGRIHCGKNGLIISSGENHYIKDCKNAVIKGNSTVTAYNNSKVEAYNNSTVTAYNNSRVRAYDNSTVKAYNNSRVTAYDNSKVTAYGDSKVTAYDNSKVTAYDNSKVEACGNSTVTITKFSLNNANNVKLSGGATLKDCKARTIYQAGDWKFVSVKE